MKYFTKLFLTLCLLPVTLFLSSNAMASCDMHFTVINRSGHYIESLAMLGPWKRASSEHSLKNGQQFSYHATGSAFSCHGKYRLMNVDITPMYKYFVISNSHDFEHNANVTVTITPHCTIKPTTKGFRQCATQWTASAS